MYTVDNKKISRNKSVRIYKKVLAGEISRFPNGYWKHCKDKNDARYCARYMIEVVMNLDEKSIYKLTKEHFKLYKLNLMLSEVYNWDVFELVDDVYPNRFCSWRFSVQDGYWNKETLCSALKEYVDKENISREELASIYGVKFISNLGLTYAVREVYEGDVYKLLKDAFHGEYEVWELKKVPNGYWNDRERAIEATRWLVRKLEWDRNDIKNNISKDTFKENGLGGMLRSVYGNSTFAAINDAFPGEYEEFEFAVPKGYWNKETLPKAMKYMIEEELKFNEDDVKNKLSVEHFKENRMVYAVNKVCEGDYYEAINMAYPGVYKKRDLKGIAFKGKRENDIVKYIKYFV